MSTALATAKALAGTLASSLALSVALRADAAISQENEVHPCCVGAKVNLVKSDPRNRHIWPPDSWVIWLKLPEAVLELPKEA